MKTSSDASRDRIRFGLLERLQLASLGQHAGFDRLTRIAARSIGTPIALITFVGPDRQWIPSRVGWSRESTTLLEAFCVCALKDANLLEVPNALADERFLANPLVTGDSAVRFYAGQPLVFKGTVLGTLCVLDTVPRTLTEADKAVLVDLAATACDLIDQRYEHLLRLDRERETVSLGRALRNSQVMLVDAQRVARMGSWELEPMTGRVLFSPAMSELLGRDLSSLSFEAFKGDFGPAQRWSGVDLAASVDQEFESFQDGKLSFYRWISRPIRSASGESLRVVGTLHDITATKTAERLLRQMEDRFRLLWQTTTDVVVMLDEGGTMLFVNPAVVHTFGHQPEDLIGANLAVLQPERLRALHTHGFERYLRTGVRRMDWRAVEAIGLHADGREIPIEISFSDMDHDGRRVFAACMRDISARKANEAERERLALQLRNAQKMEAIGALASGIAHDFNNVLAGILGNATLALDDAKPGDPLIHYVQQIQRAGKNGRDLVKQILSFARQQPQSLELCDLNDLIRDAIALIRPQLPDSVRLQLSLLPTACHVRADATCIGQVVTNLCINAAQALKPGNGCIEVGSAIRASDHEALSHLSLKPGHHIHLWVKDDGMGMDGATVARVFEPFFTTKAVGAGTGLGLAVVHGIVSAHAGHIWVDSKPGEGSTFHVRLPLETAAMTAQARLVEAPTPPRGTGQRVLYVDDDDVMLIMVERLLQRFGFIPQIFGHPEQVLAALHEDSGCVDLVVTDLDMPGMNGLELAKSLLRIRPDLPVVITSGNLSEELRAEASRVGVRMLVDKQDIVEDLASALMSLVSR